MRESALFYDGEFLYVLVPYHESGYNSDLVRVVLETYTIKGTVLTLEEEVTLMHT